MMDKPKILMSIHSDLGRSNAAGTRYGHIARHLNKRGDIETELVMRANYDNNLSATTFPMGNSIFKFIRLAKILFPFLNNKIGNLDKRIFDNFVYKKIKNKSFDIAYLNPSLPRTIKELKRRETKVVLDISITPSLGSSFDQKEIMKITDHIIAPSEITKEVIKLLKINTDTTIIPFGVDSNKFKPLSNKDNNVIKFAFAGDVGKRKGADFLLESWNNLGVNYKKIELNLYGRVRSVIKEHLKNKTDLNVRIHGFVDTSKELPKNHVFILPSLVEGSAKAIYEAMACGLPIITTPNAGSVIKDGEEGFIIPPKDTEAIKEKILYFYNNPEKIEEMGKKARKLAEKYTWERYAENVYNVYKKVLDSN